MGFKKIAAFLLSSVLLVNGLGGCGQAEKQPPTGGSSADAAKQLSTEEAAIEERKASGEYPTVVMAFPTWEGRPKGADRIQELLSAYAKEKIGVGVELEIMDIGSYAQNMTLMLSGGEQVDIFNVMNLGYSPMVTKGYCMDLEEDDLIQNYGAGILETLDPVYIKASRIGGRLYGLPQLKDIALGIGRYCVPTRFLDGIGYDYKSMSQEGEECIKTDIKTVNDIYAKLHEAYPDMFVFAPNKTTHVRNSLLYDDIGGDTFGVLMDPENSLEVTNLYESKAFLDVCKQFYNWNKLGYISQDALTETTTPQSQIIAGRAMSHLTSWKPGAKSEQVTACNEDVVLFQVLGDFTKSGAVTTYNWCINSGCEDPVAAIQFLNLLYTDAYAASLLCYGEENVDYIKNEDGFLDYPKGVDATTSEYTHGMFWLFPNQYIGGVQVGKPADIYEQIVKFNKEAPVSKALGFSFDNSAVMSEYTTLTNVYNEYINQIMLGFVEPEEALKEMNDKLYASGLEKYMAAKQEALNKWAEENKIE